MAELPELFKPHRVRVRTHQGNSGYGDVLGDPSPEVTCMRDEKRRLVRNAGGEEVVADVTLLCGRDLRALFTLDSEVDLLDGRRVFVVATHEHSDGGLGAWEHLEVSCA